MANRPTSEPSVSPADTKRILETLLHPQMKNDPYKTIMYLLPWGVKNTPLANIPGPRKWQIEELVAMGEHIQENIARVARGEPPLVYKFAMASGRGPGKSAFVAMVVLWFMSCIPGGSCIISANTDSQLTSKTFGEIKKWFAMSLNNFFFESTQKKITPTEWYADQLRKALKIDSGKFYAEGILWSAENPDAFAGEHSNIGMMLIFDEASGIPQIIYDVSDGFFTDLTIYRFFFAFSNPRKNIGPFFEIFHRMRNYWRTRQLDSRTVEGLDLKVYQEIIAKYGEDSDQAKVEVKGQFPSQGDLQFISRGQVEGAIDRQLDRYDDHAALVMGVDVARYGDDSTVIFFRRGRDARSFPITELKGADNMKVATVCADLIDKYNPDGVFIDSGAGAGVIDRLTQLGYKIHEVQFGGSSTDPQYFDHRTEIWARMRDWLSGAMLPNEQILVQDLTGPEYEFQGREDRIKLESKEKMKRTRGLASPNYGDALACTFHLKIARADDKLARRNPNRKAAKASGMDYKIFG